MKKEDYPQMAIRYKYCKKCNSVLVISGFWHSSITKDGYYNYCRRCSSKTSSIIRQKLDEKRKLLLEGKKRCTQCNEIKPLDAFHKSHVCSSGRVSRCKLCNKKYRINNKQNIYLYGKAYRQSHKDIYNRASLKWRLNNPQKAKETCRRSDKKRRKNKSAYLRMKRRTDINYKIGTNLRRRINRSIGSQNAKKILSFDKYIGCSYFELKKYIESLWKKGMSWENYGYRGWHIDHIIPCAAFNLSDIEEQKKCFHYTNLQPLWANENFKKGSKNGEKL